jgi:hypothetical protein
MRGTEDQFQAMVKQYYTVAKNYETKAATFITYCQQMEAIFASYGWSKKEFFKELNVKLGIHINERRKSKAIDIAKKKAPKKKKKDIVEF